LFRYRDLDMIHGGNWTNPAPAAAASLIHVVCSTDATRLATLREALRQSVFDVRPPLSPRCRQPRCACCRHVRRSVQTDAIIIITTPQYRQLRCDCSAGRRPQTLGVCKFDCYGNRFDQAKDSALMYRVLWATRAAATSTCWAPVRQSLNIVIHVRRYRGAMWRADERGRGAPDNGVYVLGFWPFLGEFE
jgi:hypothetical protein